MMNHPTRIKSINQKLMLLVITTSTLALVFCLTAILVNQRTLMKNNKEYQLSALADSLGVSTSVILFEFEPEAGDTLLSTLSNHPSIEVARLYNSSGEKCSEYLQGSYLKNPKSYSIPFSGERNSTLVTQQFMSVTRAVVENDETIGYVQITATMDDLNRQFNHFAMIGVAAVFFSVLAIIPLSLWMQRFVSKPIMRLANAAEEITQLEDYSLRVETTSKDEIGKLYTQFNRMLDQIQDGQHQLEQARDALEIRVRQRTGELRIANEELKLQMHERELAATELETSNQLIRLVQRVTIAANEADSTTEALLETVKAICEHHGWPLGHAVEVDPMESPVEWGESHWVLMNNAFASFTDELKLLELPLGEHLPGSAVSTGQVNAIEELGTQIEDGRADLAVEAGLNSAIAIPVFNGENVVAVMEFFSTEKISVTQAFISVYQQLTSQLAQVFERKRSADEIVTMHRQITEASRRAGMADVATGVLHNVGNVLNSVNTSTTVITENLRRSKLATLDKTVCVAEKNANDFVTFFQENPQGKMLIPFLRQLTDALHSEQEHNCEELSQLSKNIDHLKQIISMQQTYARSSNSVAESLTLNELVDDALQINFASLKKNQIEIVKEYCDSPLIIVDKHKALQILANLISNAKQSIEEESPQARRITLRTKVIEDECVIEVQDTGIGISAKNMKKIFTHGFTTKMDGHGFGLHSSANAANEMGGKLSSHSEGAGLGACFALSLPRKSEVSTALSQ